MVFRIPHYLLTTTFWKQLRDIVLSNIYVSHLQPVFHDLQATHKRKTEEFDQMKKLIVGESELLDFDLIFDS